MVVTSVALATWRTDLAARWSYNVYGPKCLVGGVPTLLGLPLVSHVGFWRSAGWHVENLRPDVAKLGQSATNATILHGGPKK